jgi:hypothetical protein
MCDCGCDFEPVVVEVNAGPHDRRNAVVSFVTEHACDEDKGHTLHEVNADGSLGAHVPCQCLGEACMCEAEDCSCCCEVVWIVPELQAGATKRYAIGLAEASASEEGGVTVELEGDEKASFYVNGDLFMSYVFKQGIARPFCYPVHGPGGKLVVREVSIPAKQGIDHEHHKGFWVAQGHVNDGEDNWSEIGDHAISNCQQVTVLSEGPVCGEMLAVSDWMSGRHGARNQMLEEDTLIRVYNTPDSGRIMDWSINFVADDKGFFFGDTKEAGTLSVRLKESMEEGNGGTIRNAYGAVGEAENWGKRAEWVDYYGPVEGETVGVTLMDHPSNHGFPTHWHVRGYGLFTANQWGLHDFTGDPAQRGDLAVKAGDVLSFRFRVYIHAGDTDAADVAGQYLNFIYPPTVREVS